MGKYDPSKCEEFVTDEHDSEMLDWLDEARSSSDLFLLSGWARERIASLKTALDEARATNAVLHRRAQGVEAGKPDDAETIRRLRREVRALAKHAARQAQEDRDAAARSAEARRLREDAEETAEATLREHARKVKP